MFFYGRWLLLVIAWMGLHPDKTSFFTDEVVQGGLKFAAACLILFIAQPRHFMARLFCASWLRWCGIISYEWYLFHQPLASWSRVYLGPAGGNPFCNTPSLWDFRSWWVGLAAATYVVCSFRCRFSDTGAVESFLTLGVCCPCLNRGVQNFISRYHFFGGHVFFHDGFRAALAESFAQRGVGH